MTSMSNTGYGIVGRNLLLELYELGVDITLWPYGSISEHPKIELFKEMVNQQRFVDGKAPCINIWHQFDLAKRIGTGVYYAWPFFELNKFTPQEKAHLTVPDYIIVSSEWAYDIVETEIPGSHIYKVPCGVDTSIFTPRDKQDPDGPYTFFNIGKWEKRKGHDVLIRAFDKAFELSDNVHLVMMPYNPFLRPSMVDHWMNMYLKSKMAQKITILNPVPTHEDVANIINNCDCGVFPSRAEGWNLELLEAMACGKPVIATNNSAHTEFCDGVNSYLIDTPDLEDACDGIFFDGHGQWAEFDIDQEEQLIEHMRYCYDKRPSNISGISTAERYSWKESANKLHYILKLSTDFD